MADIGELIQADHRRIRRLHAAMCEALHDSDTLSANWRSAPVWRRLAEVLELHFAAEEEICILSMLGASAGAAAQVQDVIADHDDIRAAIGEAQLQAAGSAPWWRAVTSVLAASARHLDREEHGILADSQRIWTVAQRQRLGREWYAFVSARLRDAVPRPPGDFTASRLRSTAGDPPPGPAVPCRPSSE